MIRLIALVAFMLEAATFPIRWILGEATFVVIDTFLESLGI